jgi:hypothetical protein
MMLWVAPQGKVGRKMRKIHPLLEGYNHHHHGTVNTKAALDRHVQWSRASLFFGQPTHQCPTFQKQKIT